ncbi:hypothetical protein MUG91_G43n127 [Manis pentadactyla]|nr:hypothetical protein MUG91_G43n127 [Manis pentadactyla]
MSPRKLLCSCPTPQAREGPARGRQRGEPLRDEAATARWDVFSALAAPSAQRPGAGQSLTPCRLPSRTGPRR